MIIRKMKQQKLLAIIINFLIVLTSFGVVVPSEEKEHPRHLETRKFRRSAQQGKSSWQPLLVIT